MPGGEEVLVDWVTAFKDGPECTVNFLIFATIFLQENLNLKSQLLGSGLYGFNAP
jgi:hypothetical protein